MCVCVCTCVYVCVFRPTNERCRCMHILYIFVVLWVFYTYNRYMTLSLNEGSKISCSFVLHAKPASHCPTDRRNVGRKFGCKICQRDH